MKVGFVSLGCSKNLVDSEMAIGLFKSHGLEIVNDPKKAEVIVVNTCGFIDSAKEEAINTILEMAEYKKNGNCKYLIAMGCLVQRYKVDLEKTLPEVDLFLSLDEYNNIWSKVSKLIKEEDNTYGDLNYLDRVITTGGSTAYLKIAEGCSNNCTYCAIPYIRGPFVSRKLEDILEEAEKLVGSGIKELIVIAQDTTKYGLDLYGEAKLPELLNRLCKIDKLVWVRFLYAYPESITEELIKVVKENKKICNYFDIPIQHISDKVLKRMNRKSDGKSIKMLIENIRKEIPDVILRTSLIVGFPGETEEDFKELYNFVKETRFNKLGVFQYSKEDGTPAQRLKEQIHGQTKKARWNKIMEVQQNISKEILKEKIGKEYFAIVENTTVDGKQYIARTFMDVPDMDGVLYIENNSKENIKLGTIVKCKITGILEYDLVGEIV